MSHSDYDSPFHVVMQNIANSVTARIDEEVGKVFLTTAMSVGVDKDKLMEIMKQDRSRYVEAYQRGYNKRDDEIVRCKNCRWWHESELEQFKEYGECGQANGIALKPHDWFCADGEWRQDDD